MLRFTVNDWLYSKGLGAQITYDEYLLLHEEQRESIEAVTNAWIKHFMRGGKQ